MGKGTPLSEKGNRPICFLSVQGLAATNRSAQEALERKTQTDFKKQGMGGGRNCIQKTPYKKNNKKFFILLCSL